MWLCTEPERGWSMLSRKIVFMLLVCVGGLFVAGAALAEYVII